MFYENEPHYKDYLPDKFQGKVEIDEIDGCINIQIGKLMERMKRGVDNKSVMESDVEGIVRWEQMLGVSTARDSSLQARREAVRAKLMTKPPINLVVLKSIIEAYMGLLVDIELAEGFVIKVRYRGNSRVADLKPLYATIYDTIPANLIVDIAYLYLTWGETDARALTWGETNALNLTWRDWERGQWLG